jgi:arylsulfatase A-like enzyme
MNPGSVAATLLAGLLAGCGAPPAPPSVLLVSIDTLRRDHVSAYGYERDTTPALDALAREGALFENAMSSSNWTLPAHMSMLTGLPPALHGVEQERDRVDPGVRLLAESFREAGHATAGFVSHVLLETKFGFDRGFDVYRVDADQRAERVSQQALDWLEERGDEPFFLFLHYFDPHWDYDPPDDFRRRFGSPPRRAGRFAQLFRYVRRDVPMPPVLRGHALALYDAEIAYTDHELSRVLSWLRRRGRLDRTAVAVISDHGEEFGEHAGFGHGTHLHEEVTGVPLLLRFPPGIAPGTRRSDLAGPVDLPATLLRLAGLAPDPQFLSAGVALFPAADAAEGASQRALVAESSRNGPKRFAIRRGDAKLLGAGSYRPVSFRRREGRVEAFELPALPIEPALYDLRRDPEEARNLVGDPGARPEAERLRAELLRYVELSARGLRLRCAAGTRGTAAFDAPLVDEPYPLAPDAAAQAQPLGAEPLAARRFRIDFRPGSDAATLVFPTAGAGGALELALEGSRTSLAIPAEGTSVPAGERCQASVPEGLASGGERVDLAPGDQETLRALGYVE